jgi:hypothetical protein
MARKPKPLEREFTREELKIDPKYPSSPHDVGNRRPPGLTPGIKWGEKEAGHGKK